MAKPTLASLPQSANVQGLWTFEETSGNAVDSSGNSRDLTDNNSVGNNASTPVSGFARSRDLTGGTSQNFSIADAAWNSPTGAFTYAVWVKPTSGDLILNKWKATGGSREIILSTGGMSVSSDGSASTSVSFGTAVGTGTWKLLVWVYEPSTRLEVYQGGVSDGTNVTSIPASLHDSDDTLYFGRYDPSDGNGTISALFQYGVLWDVALTDAEVTTFSDLFVDITTTSTTTTTTTSSSTSTTRSTSTSTTTTSTSTTRSTSTTTSTTTTSTSTTRSTSTSSSTTTTSTSTTRSTSTTQSSSSSTTQSTTTSTTTSRSTSTTVTTTSTSSSTSTSTSLATTDLPEVSIPTNESLQVVPELDIAES